MTTIPTFMTGWYWQASVFYMKILHVAIEDMILFSNGENNIYEQV